jgi:tetratricopeptide (TPR) repeat protein
VPAAGTALHDDADSSSGGDRQSVSVEQAEQLYRSSRFDEALAAFRAMVGEDPANAHAWLRIGNVLHRKRDWFDALSAYRKAARPQADPAIREKAVYNIALLNLELARQALKRLERLRTTPEPGQAAQGVRGAGVSDGALRQLSEQVASGYRDLAALRQAQRASDTGMTAALAPASKAGEAQAMSPTERIVEVEIRQGGGGK